MKHSSRAFTLIEVVTVLAVLAVLSAIMLPVFVSAKSAARRSVCASNFRNVHLATELYMSDYDDMFMPVNHQPATTPNSQNDRTWVQMLLPYLRSYGVFQCPSDHSPKPMVEASFDRDLVPGDTYSRYYTASLRTNVGYNYLYLAPIVRSAGQWVAQPRSSFQVVNPSSMIMFVDSVWDRNADGDPIGGGNWLVIPPCRYELINGSVHDTFGLVSRQVFTLSLGWASRMENSEYRYGGAWPWHDGRMTVVRVDGSARAITPSQLAEGCDVEPNWRGFVNNMGSYQWDLD